MQDKTMEKVQNRNGRPQGFPFFSAVVACSPNAVQAAVQKRSAEISGIYGRNLNGFSKSFNFYFTKNQHFKEKNPSKIKIILGAKEILLIFTNSKLCDGNKVDFKQTG